MGQQWSVTDELKVELTGVEEVSLRIVGGEVCVTATDGPARLEIDRVDNGPVQVSLEDGVLSILHDGGDRGRGLFRRIVLDGASCRVLIAVPARTRAQLATVSADVLAAGLTEPVEVRTVSGDVTMKAMTERVEVRTVSGDVEAFALAGDLSFATVSGDIGIVNGTCRWLQAKTVSGDFTLDLALPRGSVYSIGTVSGDVSLRFPPDPSVVVDATSMSGDLRADFDAGGWDKGGMGRPNRLRGTLGAGDSRLTIKTLSGDVRIARKEAAA
jgi:DUF4097 and DUF4098 domain-containing protein YvlB